MGEKLITAKSEPVFGCVYKLCGLERNGEMIPKIKLSENPEKINNPGFKKVYRLYDNETNKMLGDVIALYDEEKPSGDEYEIFDPNAIWKRKKLTNFHARELLVPVFEGGRCVYESPDLSEIRDYCIQQQELLWDETKRFENPQTYYVDLTQKLWDLKNRMIEDAK